MEKKLKIRELAEYYVKRYGLTPYDKNANTDEYNGDVRTIATQITRTMKETKIGEKYLWDTIKPDKGDHAISIEDFEKQCFTEWVRYLHDNREFCKDNANFMQDKKKNHIYDSEDEYWKDRVQSFTENNDSFYENGGNDDINEELLHGFPANMVTQEDVEKMAYKMMFRALYDVFYEPFNWDMLRYDLENKPTDNEYGTKFTKEQVHSSDRLSDYKNYIGKRKA